MQRRGLVAPHRVDVETAVEHGVAHIVELVADLLQQLEVMSEIILDLAVLGHCIGVSMIACSCSSNRRRSRGSRRPPGSESSSVLVGDAQEVLGADMIADLGADHVVDEQDQQGLGHAARRLVAEHLVHLTDSRLARQRLEHLGLLQLVRDATPSRSASGVARAASPRASVDFSRSIIVAGDVDHLGRRDRSSTAAASSSWLQERLIRIEHQFRADPRPAAAQIVSRRSARLSFFRFQGDMHRQRLVGRASTSPRHPYRHRPARPGWSRASWRPSPAVRDRQETRRSVRPRRRSCAPRRRGDSRARRSAGRRRWWREVAVVIMCPITCCQRERSGGALLELDRSTLWRHAEQLVDACRKSCFLLFDRVSDSLIAKKGIQSVA